MEKNLELLKPISWDELFEIWEDEEAKLDHWIEHYTQRGFSSWREWRDDSFRPLQPETLSWKLYRVLDPRVTVPQFRGGRFRGWTKKIYSGRETPTFAEIVQHPTIQHEQRVKEMIENFPKHSQLIGLAVGEDVFIVDGMHRCCAIALAASRGQAIESEITIALADFNGRELPPLGQVESPT